jgi:hypothetical protein
MRSQAALAIRQGTLKERLDLGDSKRLEGEDLAAAQKRRVDGEKRILRRRPNKNDAPFLDVGQQHVLLGPVEAVQLIDEQQRALAPRGQLRGGFLQDLAQLLDARRDRVQLAEPAARVAGDDVGQGRLAAAGRAVKDDRAQSIRLEQPAQQLAGAEKVLLAGEFVECSGPHPRCQRFGSC